jgi:hypothetical protein
MPWLAALRNVARREFPGRKTAVRAQGRSRSSRADAKYSNGYILQPLTNLRPLTR